MRLDAKFDELELSEAEAKFDEAKFKFVGRGSVAGISFVVPVSAAGQLASISCFFLRSFFVIGEPGAKARVLPDWFVCFDSSLGAASSALPGSIQL